MDEAGKEPTVSQNRATQAGPDETLDRLTSALRILQRRRGHRAATDDTLLAWAAAGARPDALRVLDLGSGKGTVAMLLLQRLPGCRVVGVEAEAVNHDLALRNRLLNGLSARWTPRLGDLRDSALLAGEAPFDLIAGAPPFMPVGSGPLPKDPQRAAGRFELRGGVDDYVATAARHLGPQGAVVILMDGLGRARAEAAFAAGGLGLRRRVAILPCPDRPPTYWIFVAAPGEGELVEGSLALRLEPGGAPSVEMLDIRRGLDLLPDSGRLDSPEPL
jgi:tRNA1Val (adenine37-N6)-methyltransferase